jgi:hypothetical protein
MRRRAQPDGMHEPRVHPVGVLANELVWSDGRGWAANGLNCLFFAFICVHKVQQIGNKQDREIRARHLVVSFRSP